MPRRSRGGILMLLIILLLVKIFFGIEMIHQRQLQHAKLVELEKSTKATCEKSVALCEKVTGHSCGKCE